MNMTTGDGVQIFQLEIYFSRGLSRARGQRPRDPGRALTSDSIKRGLLHGLFLPPPFFCDLVTLCSLEMSILARAEFLFPSLELFNHRAPLFFVPLFAAR